MQMLGYGYFIFSKNSESKKGQYCVKNTYMVTCFDAVV